MRPQPQLVPFLVPSGLGLGHRLGPLPVMRTWLGWTRGQGQEERSQAAAHETGGVGATGGGETPRASLPPSCGEGQAGQAHARRLQM